MILAFQLEAMNHSDGDIIAKWITCVAAVVKMRTIVCNCGWTLATLVEKKSLSCKILQDSGRILQDDASSYKNFFQNLTRSYKINFFLTRILQDKLFLTRILQDTLFLTRILQDTLFLTRMLQDTLFLSRILQYTLYFQNSFSASSTYS